MGGEIIYGALKESAYDLKRTLLHPLILNHFFCEVNYSVPLWVEQARGRQMRYP